MSPNQLAANRANAQHSTGPKTETGKRRSSFNAFKHGLTGKVHIATPEDSAAFQKHCQAYREALAPVGTLEIELAGEIAEDRWRVKRARSLENSIFAEGHHRHAGELPSGHPEIDAALAEGKTWDDRSRSFQLLTLYESRIRRTIEKNTAEFKQLQADRKAAYAQAQREAVLLAQYAESKGETYQPRDDFSPAHAHGGFVYSSSEMARFVNRDQRLRAALYLPEPKSEPALYADAARGPMPCASAATDAARA